MSESPVQTEVATNGQHAEHGQGAGQEPRHACNRDVEASRLQIEYWAALAVQARNDVLAASLRGL